MTNTSAELDKKVSTAIIIIIGNEVLSGKVVDSNSPYLLKELHELGVDVRRVMTIPDCRETIADDVARASESCDFVLTSGGIGPTHDDMTMASIARAFGLELEENSELRALVDHYFKGRVTRAALRMASIPAGSRLIYGGQLRFPLVVCRNVYVFPGVPEILISKFETVKEEFRGAPYHLVTIFTRESESALASNLEETLRRFPDSEIGSYPCYRSDDYRVMLTLESKNLKQLMATKDDLLSRMSRDLIVRIKG